MQCSTFFMSIEKLSVEQLQSLQSCAERLFRESRADLKLLYAAALRGIREEMKQRRQEMQVVIRRSYE